jgi:hypothetical protein
LEFKSSLFTKKVIDESLFIDSLWQHDTHSSVSHIECGEQKSTLQTIRTESSGMS